MKERISALMDGEVDGSEVGRCLDAVKGNADLRRAWDSYHLIGDSIRGHAGPAFHEKVARRLAAEPTVLAPRRMLAGRRLAPFAYSTAAVAAGIALVVWLGMPLLNPLSQQTAVSSGRSQEAIESPDATPVDTGVENYLLAHQGYSPASAIQGVAPYVRTVADEGLIRGQ